MAVVAPMVHLSICVCGIDFSTVFTAVERIDLVETPRSRGPTVAEHKKGAKGATTEADAKGAKGASQLLLHVPRLNATC